MGETTGISWTNSTWSPIRARVKREAGQIAADKGYISLVHIADRMAGRVGPHCERVSAGCGKPGEGDCYSATNNLRCLPANGTGLPFDRRSRDLVDVFIDEKILEQPLHWRKPRRIFVENQSDLFGEWIPDEMILRCFGVMRLCPHHTFQVLTKRAERLPAWGRKNRANCSSSVEVFNIGRGSVRSASWINPLENVWLGVSVENYASKYRIDLLQQTPATLRFLSVEPLLEDLGNLDLSGIGWVIVGGQSGHGAVPMNPGWVRNIRDQCIAAGIPFFFKQWGAWVGGSHDGNGWFFPYTGPAEGVSGSERLVRWGGGVASDRVKKGKVPPVFDGFEWKQFPAVAADGREKR